MAGPEAAPPARASRFIEWLNAHTTKVLKDRIGVSGTTINNWRAGKAVGAAQVPRLKLEAAKDGVILETDELVGVPQ